MRTRTGSGKLLILLVFLVAAAAMVAVVAGWVAFQRSAPSPAPTAGAPEPPPPPVAPPPPSGPDGTALARIRARGTLLVAMDTGEPPWTGTPPMYFRDAAGDDAGFDVEVARRIAREVGVTTVKIVHAKYADLPAALTAPDALPDLLISGWVPTDEAGIAWSVPYLEFGLCLVVPAKSKVQTVQDLWGKRVGIFDDDAAAEEVQRLVKGYKELVRLQDGYWDQLQSGRFDGFIYDYPYAVAEIGAYYKQNPHRQGSFRIAQYNLTDSTYAVGVREAEADLRAAVDRAVEAWRATPDYAAAIKQHLSGGLAVTTALPAGQRVVEVKAGDTLSGIAARELGAVDRWRELWELNKERFPNPHLIEVGDRVLLP